MSFFFRLAIFLDFALIAYIRLKTRLANPGALYVEHTFSRIRSQKLASLNNRFFRVSAHVQDVIDRYYQQNTT